MFRKFSKLFSRLVSGAGRALLSAAFLSALWSHSAGADAVVQYTYDANGNRMQEIGGTPPASLSDIAAVVGNPQSFNGNWPGFAFGLPGDIPFVMRLNDGLVPVVFRPSSALWYIDLAGFASGTAFTKVVSFGLVGDVPQIVSLNGSDHLAVYRPATGQAYLDLDNETYSVTNQLTLPAWAPAIPALVSLNVSTPSSFGGSWYDGFSFGVPGDVPLTIQLTAGGPKLPVVFRPSASTWYIDLAGYAQYGASTTRTVAFGIPGDVPMILYWQGGDHIAVYRPSTGQTLISTDNQSFSGSNLAYL